MTLRVFFVRFEICEFSIYEKSVFCTNFFAFMRVYEKFQRFKMTSLGLVVQSFEIKSPSLLCIIEFRLFKLGNYFCRSEFHSFYSLVQAIDIQLVLGARTQNWSLTHRFNQNGSFWHYSGPQSIEYSFVRVFAQQPKKKEEQQLISVFNEHLDSIEYAHNTVAFCKWRPSTLCVPSIEECSFKMVYIPISIPNWQSMDQQLLVEYKKLSFFLCLSFSFRKL